LFSPLSEAVVLFTVPAVFWHLLILQSAAKVSLLQKMVVGAFSLGWTALAYSMVRFNSDAPFVQGTPLVYAKPFVGLALISALTWVFRKRLLGHSLGHSLGEGVPQQWLIALQLFRPIGLVFILEHHRGMLPAIFALPAGWGDLLAGLVALAVLLRYPTGTVPAKAVLTVAIVGLLDFFFAFFFGFSSSASPLQLFSFDAPNPVLNYPLGLIPMFLVPYAVAAHLLSLAQLQHDEAIAREPLQ
jgi:hypothetical protein